MKVKYYVAIRIYTRLSPAGVTTYDTITRQVLAVDIIGAARQAKKIADLLGGQAYAVREDLPQ